MSAYTVTTAPGGFELLTDDTKGRGRVIVLALGAGRAWTYSWPKNNRGGPADEDVFAWLGQCDLDYVAKKFKARDTFDAEGTVRSVRGEICRGRREWGGWTREQARTLWDSLEGVTCEQAWTIWFVENRDGDSELAMQEAYEHSRRIVDPEFRAAWTVLVPHQKRVRGAA